MPLFSSKFAFKKSPRRSSSSSIIQKNQESSNSTSSDNEDDDDFDIKNKTKKSINGYGQKKDSSQLLKSGGKNGYQKQQQQKSSSKNRTKKHRGHKLKSDHNHTDDPDDLILYTNSMIRKFKFDHKHGKWNEINSQHQLAASTTSINSLTENLSSTNASNGTSVQNEQMEELIDSINKLKEENRLLKLKIEILIEMVTETTAELNLKDSAK